MRTHSRVVANKEELENKKRGSMRIHKCSEVQISNLAFKADAVSQRIVNRSQTKVRRDKRRASLHLDSNLSFQNRRSRLSMHILSGL